MKIRVRNNNVESAIRVFKKKSSEIIFEYREREYFGKPSTKRHKAKQAAKAREARRTKKDKVFTRGDRKF